MSDSSPTLEQWRMLQAVVDRGSFSAAAEHLRKSQSTVSYGLQRLQEQLGLPILTVSGRRAVLTEAGEALLRHARRLLEDAGALDQLAANLARGWEAELTVVMDVICPAPLLMDTLAAFERRHPQVRLEIRESALSGTSDAIVNQEADIAVTGMPPPGFLGERLTHIEFVAVAHRDHPLNHKVGPLTEADLQAHRQIVVRDSGAYRRLSTGWLGAEKRWTVDHFSQSVDLLVAGFGFAWVPKHKLGSLLIAGTLVPLSLAQGARRRVDILRVFPKRERTGPAARLFADLLKQAAEKAG